MSTLFLLILVMVALVVTGFFLPVLWIVAAAVLVIGLVHAWQMARTSTQRAREE